MKTHTPGPWSVSKQNDQSVVTSVGDFYWFSWVHLPHEHERYGINPEADARLIAAAPDLLEALEMLLIIDHMTGSDSIACIKQAKAAIKKAREAV